MLLQKLGFHGGGPLAPTAHDGLEVVNPDDAYGPTSVSQAKSKWRRSQRFNWESPYEPAWSPVPQGAASEPDGGLQSTHGGYHHINPDVHELASPEMQAPIELAATPVDRGRYSGTDW